VPPNIIATHPPCGNLSGMCTGLIENFLFLFLENELGASKALIGLSRTVTCASEVRPAARLNTEGRRFGSTRVGLGWYKYGAPGWEESTAPCGAGGAGGPAPAAVPVLLRRGPRKVPVN